MSNDSESGMYKPPRRLYVTHEEFERLQQLCGKAELWRGAFAGTDEKLVLDVAELLDVGVDLLKQHTWHVEVVEGEVNRRVGRNWTTRGTHGRH
jgi:hypothetical protein